MPTVPGDPVLAASEPRAREDALSRTARLSRFGSEAWRDIERVWLDPIALPFGRRAIDAGWTPDAPAVYCNRCGHGVGPHEEDAFGCAACRDRLLPWDRFVRLGSYVAPLSDWVCEVKFTRFSALGVELGRCLGEQVRSARRSSLGVVLEEASPLVVPVPTTWIRRTSRGIDHAGVIARGVAHAVGGIVVRGVGRTHRPSQRSLAPSQRAANVRRSFRARTGWLSPSSRVRGRAGAASHRLVLLVDDVLTTGATMTACAKALRVWLEAQGGGAPGRRWEIWACALAVTPERGRGSEPAGSSAVLEGHHAEGDATDGIGGATRRS